MEWPSLLAPQPCGKPMIEGWFDDATPWRLRRLRQDIRHRFFETETYSTIRATAPNTEIRCHVRGLGDEMMIRQLVAAFSAYLGRYGDPELGSIVLVAGGYMPYEPFEAGDVTLYWWYSHGPFDSEPDRFIPDYFRPNIAVEPDLMLCGSKRIEREAREAGYPTLYFPIGTYGYEPLGLNREGMGYAGSREHKDETEVQNLMGPYMQRDDFEWVDDLRSIAELNLWYNTKLLTFGLTKQGQQEWGVVNSRVFEALATGTPLLIPEHPTLEEVLGFDYPYQISQHHEVREKVESMEQDPEEIIAEFEQYAERVRDDHSYVERLRTLFSAVG